MLVRLIEHYEKICTYKTKNTPYAQLQATEDQSCFLRFISHFRY